MQISIVQGHNKYQKTDHLYDPLRKAFLSVHHNNKLQQMKEACKVSHISHVVNNLTYGECLELAEHTLIPEDVNLRPTHHYWKIPKDHQYRIVNVEKRILQPITKEELQKKLYEKKQDEIIVYSIESSENKKQRIQTINYLKNNVNINHGYESQFLNPNSRTYQQRIDSQKKQVLFKRSAVQTSFNHQFKTNYQQANFNIPNKSIDLVSKPILEIEPKHSQNNEKFDILANPRFQNIRPNSLNKSNQVGSNQNIDYSYTSSALRPDTISLPKNNQPFGFKHNSLNEKKIQEYTTTYHESYLPSMDTTFMIDRMTVTPNQSKPLSTQNGPILNHNALSRDFRNTITPIKRSQIKSPHQNSFNNSTDKNSALRNTSALTKIKSFKLASEQPIQQKSLNYQSPSPIAKTEAKVEQTVPQLSHRQLRQRRKSGIKLTNPNYNLFSTIDQPVNNILNGKICTCPHNQIIAQKVHQITWYSNMKGDQLE